MKNKLKSAGKYLAIFTALIAIVTALLVSMIAIPYAESQLISANAEEESYTYTASFAYNATSADSITAEFPRSYTYTNVTITVKAPTNSFYVNTFITYIKYYTSSGTTNYLLAKQTSSGESTTLDATEAANNTPDGYKYFTINPNRTVTQTPNSQSITITINYEWDSYQEGYDDGYNAGYEAGIADGYQEGYNDGYSAGEAAGYESGYNAGYEAGAEEGYQEGYQDAINSIATANLLSEDTFIYTYSSVSSYTYSYTWDTQNESMIINVTGNGGTSFGQNNLGLIINSNYYGNSYTTLNGKLKFTWTESASAVYLANVYTPVWDENGNQTNLYLGRLELHNGSEFEITISGNYNWDGMFYLNWYGMYNTNFNVENFQISYTAYDIESILENSYNSGYEDGYEKGHSAYETAYDNGYNTGYYTGYNLGAAEAGEYTFTSLIAAVVNTPINTFTSMLDFEILGFNVAGLMISLLSVILLVKLIKYFSGKI